MKSSNFSENFRDCVKQFQNTFPIVFSLYQVEKESLFKKNHRRDQIDPLSTPYGKGLSYAKISNIGKFYLVMLSPASRSTQIKYNNFKKDL